MKIKIGKKEYVLGERIAQDVLDLRDYTQRMIALSKMTLRMSIYILAQTICQSIKANNRVRFWNWKVKPYFIMRKFKMSEIEDYSNQVLVAEGLDPKKKVQTKSQSTGELQKI